jgi:hypothetical protein
MIRSLLRRMVHSELDDLMNALTTAQYLNPHEPLARSLARTGDSLGVCPQAVNHAVAWLAVDPATPIGRLRRTELMQLARSIHRFWRQPGAAAAAAAAAGAGSPQPTPQAQPSERRS